MLVRLTFLLLMLLGIPISVGAAVIQLPKTGQNMCWDENANVIDCAGTTHDGATQIGVAWPAPRFVDNGDGTLTDSLTDLLWLKNANCYGSMGWQQALDRAGVLAGGECGLSDGSHAGDWRLPNRKELLSIATQNFSNGGAWLASQGFVNAQHAYYWTADTCLDYGGIYKWIVQPVGAAYPDSWNEPIGSRLAMFVRYPPQVTVTAAVTGGHGSISSTTPLTVAPGTAVSMTLAPDTGYYLGPVTGSCPGGTFAGNTYAIDRIVGNCSVDFSFAPYTFRINTSTSGSGGIQCTPSKTVAYNTDTTCTARPSTGYHITGVTVDGVDQAVSNPANFSYPFTAVTADHTMSASFAINSYTVTFVPGSNGTLDGITTQTVTHGGSTSSAVLAVPAAGYHFVNWTGDNGFTATRGNPLTVVDVTSNLTITANFDVATHVVTPGTAPNGVISPATPQSVGFNEVTSFTLTPDAGYRIAAVTGCGGDLTGTTYTTGPVTGNCSIAFSFEPLTYTISTPTSGSGNIRCTPAATVNYNTPVSCTASPATGYHIAELSVDGQQRPVADPASFTNDFGAVTADHAISAVFAIDSYAVAFSAGSNGTLAGATSQAVSYGGSTSAVTALPAVGYHFLNWTGDNGFAPTTANPLALTNVAGPFNLTANFGIDTHLVTPGGTVNGGFTPAVPQTVTYNGVATFTLVPNEGYLVASASGCGGTLNGSTFTTAPVTADCTVTATFQAKPPTTYTISATAADGKGIISCTQTVTAGGTATCTITPRPGYELATLIDNSNDSRSMTSNNNYTISNVLGDHTVVATFSSNTYGIDEIMLAYKSMVGQGQLPDAEKSRCDVAPLGNDGAPAPDGNIDVADVVILLRKLVGAVNW